MTRCACPPPSPYTAAVCCRPDADVPCEMGRCQHKREETAQELFDELQAVGQMLKDARHRHEQAAAALQEAGGACIELNAEWCRLWAELESALKGGTVAVETLPDLVTVAGPVVNAMNAAIEIDHGG